MTPLAGRSARIAPVLVNGSALVSAVAVGALTAASVKLGVGLLIALCYVPLVLVNLPVGIMLWTGLTFVESLPAVSVAPNAARLLILLAWLGTLLTRRQEVSIILRRHRVLTLASAGFLIWLTLSPIWATEAGLAWNDLWNWYVAGFVLLIAATSLRKPSQVRLVLLGFVGGAVLSVLIGLAQNGLVSTTGAIDTATRSDGRLQGGGGDPNYLAAGLVPAIVLASTLLPQVRGAASRFALGVAVPILGIGLAATESRGGLVAVAFTIVAALLFYKRRRAATLGLVAAIMLAFGAWFAATPAAFQRVTDFNGGGTGREDLWAVAWEIFQDHPVYGVGLNNFRAESYRYVRRPGALKRVDLIAERPDIVHNTYLQLLVEVGVVGLVLWLAAVLACLRSLWAAARRFDDLAEQGLADVCRAVLISAIGLLGASFFISNATDNRLWVLLALGPALFGISLKRAHQATALG